MTRTLLAVGSLLAVLVMAQQAQAVTNINGTANADLIVFGTDGTNIVSCLNDSLTTHQAGSTTLNTDYKVFAGSGNDEVRVLFDTSDTFACNGTDLTGNFSYSTFFVDVDGDAGNDRIAGGNGEGVLDGLAGDDRVTVREPDTGSTITRAEGGDSSDMVCSTVAAEDLRGEAGDDCLERVSTATGADTLFDCGTDVTDDLYVSDTGVTQVNCEVTTANCAFCYLP